MSNIHFVVYKYSAPTVLACTPMILTVCPDLQQQAASNLQHVILFVITEFQPQNPTGREACAFPGTN